MSSMASFISFWSPRCPHLKDAKPIYRDFRAGDVRHSLSRDRQSAAGWAMRPPTVWPRAYDEQWRSIEGRIMPNRRVFCTLPRCIILSRKVLADL